MARSLTDCSPPAIEVEPAACAVCNASAAGVEARGKDYLYHTSEQGYQFVCCQKCGHLYLNPRPTIREISRIYPKEYVTFSKRFAKEGGLLTTIKDKVLLGRFASLAAMLPAQPHILDVGCGDGQFLISLRRNYPAARLAGLDWSFGPGVAEELAALNIVALVGTIESAELPEQHYDLIVMNQLIEHVWDVKLVIERCRRALKVGGLLAVETPNPDGWDRRLFRSGAWGGYYWPRHLNLFSRKHLVRLIEGGGFDVVQTTSLLAPPCWISSCHATAERLGFGRWSGKIFADTNIAWLAIFSVVDYLAMLAGAETSNQKIVARRKS